MREFFDKWARAKGQFKGTTTRTTTSRASRRDSPERRRGRRRHRMHRLRRLLCVVRRRRRGARISSARRRSTARGRSSTTCATSRSASACARSPATPAATRATRRARAPSAARSSIAPTAGIAGTEARSRRGRRSGASCDATARDAGAALVLAARQRDGAGAVRRRAPRGIVYAVRGGLTAAEILGRTRGNCGVRRVLRACSSSPARSTRRSASRNIVAEMAAAWRERRARALRSRRCSRSRSSALGLRAVYAVVASDDAHAIDHRARDASGVVGVRRPSRVGPRARRVPAAALLGAGHGAARRGGARRFPALHRQRRCSSSPNGRS